MQRMALIARIAGLLLAVTSPSLAQQPQPSSPPANAVLERLLQNSKNKDLTQPQTSTMTELKGYVGPSVVCVISPCPVRLYWDLSLTRYWDIPPDAIVQHVPGNDPKNDPVTLYVTSTAPMVTGTTMPAGAVVVQRAIIDGLGNIPFEGPGVGAGRPRARDALGGAGGGALHGALFGCAAGIPAACAVVFGAGVGAILLQ